MGRSLGITFPLRLISDAPLKVLNHLYYYTTQYGLSVKQFTGRHQDYWRDLPDRLRGVEGNAKALSLVLKELEALAAGYETRRSLRRRRQREWQGKEIVISAQLTSVLTAIHHGCLLTHFES